MLSSGAEFARWAAAHVRAASGFDAARCVNLYRGYLAAWPKDSRAQGVTHRCERPFFRGVGGKSSLQAATVTAMVLS